MGWQSGTDADESATYTTQRSRAPAPTPDMRTPCCVDAARSDVLSSVESRKGRKKKEAVGSFSHFPSDIIMCGPSQRGVEEDWKGLMKGYKSKSALKQFQQMLAGHTERF